MSKGEQDYVTTSTDYADKKIGHTMRKRGQLEVNHHSFSLYSPTNKSRREQQQTGRTTFDTTSNRAYGGKKETEEEQETSFES